MGQERDFGSGARALTMATGQVMKRFCTRFHNPPGKKTNKKLFVKKKLFKQLFMRRQKHSLVYYKRPTSSIELGLLLLAIL